jgi:UDP-glucose 4-epimerase
MNTKKAWNETFNIGSEVQISINNLAKKVIKITSSKSKIKKIPYKDVYNKNFEDMHKRTPDISKLKKFINYTPNKTIDKIIRETVN